MKVVTAISLIGTTYTCKSRMYIMFAVIYIYNTPEIYSLTQWQLFYEWKQYILHTLYLHTIVVNLCGRKIEFSMIQYWRYGISISLAGCKARAQQGLPLFGKCYQQHSLVRIEPTAEAWDCPHVNLLPFEVQ